MNPAVLSSSNNFIIAFLASFLVWAMAAGLIVLWVVDGRIKKEQVLHAILASLVAWVLSQMLKNIFPVPRPYEVNGSLPLTLTEPLDPAFPSVHTAFAFGMAVSVWLHDKKVGFLFILIACLVGYGRIASNVHFLIDVLGGAFLGIITAIVVSKAHLHKLI
jgi:undecaprenyl-diphosphatase